MDTNKRYEKAKERLFNNTPADRILKSVIMPEYVDFIVTCGGDACTYRIYDDGRIGEKQKGDRKEKKNDTDFIRRNERVRHRGWN